MREETDPTVVVDAIRSASGAKHSPECGIGQVRFMSLHAAPRGAPLSPACPRPALHRRPGAVILDNLRKLPPISAWMEVPDMLSDIEADGRQDDIIYPSAVPFLSVHLACFAAIWRGS